MYNIKNKIYIKQNIYKYINKMYVLLPIQKALLQILAVNLFPKFILLLVLFERGTRIHLQYILYTNSRIFFKNSLFLGGGRRLDKSYLHLFHVYGCVTRIKLSCDNLYPQVFYHKSFNC